MFMKIALLGMSMVGKTTLAQKIAQHFNILHLDTDYFIEQKNNTSIQTFFAQQGEAHFRRLEHQALKDILHEFEKQNFILSCGGGLPCFYDNMQILNAHTHTIYLDAPLYFFELQLERNPDWKNRPLLQHNENPLQAIQTLMEKRKPFYEQAHYIQKVDLDIEVTFQNLVHYLNTLQSP